MNNNCANNLNKFALIGKGISYSLSKILHEKLFELKGYNNLSYDILDVDNLDEIIDTLKTKYKGFNVTKPYKIDIMKYLDEVDDDAKVIGSINTVVNVNGKLKGYNTDLNGIMDTFKKDGMLCDGKNCLVVGYGGVAKTVVYALHKMGAKSINVTGRNLDKMQSFKQNVECMDIQIDIDKECEKSYDIAINCTSLGNNENDKTPIDVGLFYNIEYYFDLIYSPRKTKTLKELEEHGVKCSDGLYMLASQGVFADEYYLDSMFNRDDINDIYLYLSGEIFKNSLKSKNFDNILLVGFMGSGKSTIGEKLAKYLDLDFVDTDKVIESRFGSIKDIFEKSGESKFREIEHGVLEDILKRKNCVISTGGGIVMNDKNIDAIKKSNSLVLFLDCPFNVISQRVNGSDRPLFKDEDKARNLYDLRYDKYKEISNCIIKTNDELFNILDRIFKIN